MTDIIKNAMILAAGFGKRLQPIIGNLPKPLVEIAGKTMLEIAIAALNKLKDIQNIYINVHWQAVLIRDHVKNLETDKNIYLVEEEVILEAGGGILNVLNKISSQYLLIKNADVLLLNGTTLYENLIHDFYKKAPTALLMLVNKNGLKATGDFSLAEDNYIFRGAENDYIYTGCGILSKDLFKDINQVEPFPLNKLLFLSQKDNYKKYNYRGLILPEEAQWFDIGTPESLSKARSTVFTNSGLTVI
ncbi:MAG: NTP transferase domain-containing protein [Candidatus Midichloria sp.]|nr:NTP transferase domain-containing protein [Candidatus Midichloria sp.]